MWYRILTGVLAIGLGFILIYGRSNPVLTGTMVWLSLLFLLCLVRSLSIRGVVFDSPQDHEYRFYIKCGWTSWISGTVMSAVAFFVLELPLYVAGPIMVLTFGIGTILFPPMFYNTQSKTYDDKHFVYIFALSLGVAFAIFCMLAGMYYYTMIRH